jgi:hypothetical protein
MQFKKWLEMTMSYGQMQDLPFPDFTQAQHIGDIEHHKILHTQINNIDYYAITVDNQPATYTQTQQKTIQGKSYEEINLIQTLPEYRNQNLAKKLIFFLKTSLKKSFLLGDKQSRLGQAFAQSLAKTQKFPMYWLNTQTGEKHPYDPTTDHFTKAPYRHVYDVTDWQIMIEALRPESTTFPQYIPPDFTAKDWHHKYIIWFD